MKEEYPGVANGSINLFILVNTHGLFLSYVSLRRCVESSGRKARRAKDTNQCLQD